MMIAAKGYRMKDNVEGYLRYYRKIKRCKFYTDANTMLLFQHILIEASWTNTKEEARGELKTSVTELASDLKKDRKVIRKSLNILVEENVIELENIGRGYKIRVLNYDKYQAKSTL